MVKETSKHFHRSLIFRELHHTKKNQKQQKKKKKRKGDNSMENGQRIQRGNSQKRFKQPKNIQKDAHLDQ